MRGKSRIACEKLRPSTSDWCSALVICWTRGCFSRFSSTPRLSSSVIPACRRWPSCSVKISSWPCGILRFCVGGATAGAGLPSTISGAAGHDFDPNRGAILHFDLANGDRTISDVEHALDESALGIAGTIGKLRHRLEKSALELTCAFAAVHSLGYVSPRNAIFLSRNQARAAAEQWPFPNTARNPAPRFSFVTAGQARARWRS